jgi:ribosomal protein L12E/L44/L45/RPP1/RPP2|tara:strand:- start:1039 stop:1407 length:369 start_codon:yes stop_codon:yes gene_type:complete
MINEVNQNGKSNQENYLKTKKKGNVTVNPKKEDLMSELYTKNLRNALQDIKEKAVTAANETKQKEKKALKKEDPQGGDVQPQNPTCEDHDDSGVKAEIAERMRQRLLQLTADHDSKYMLEKK